MRRALLVALLLVACAHAPRGSPGDAFAEGNASFYGRGFEGKLTASGEPFDPSQHTAAHRTLRFGTCVLVENAENGRVVRVRINDRGPYAQGRILDLSEGAARELDMLKRGVARVRLYAC